MPELKQLHKDAIPAALEKAERYRLLNEPGEAESICLDILAVDPKFFRRHGCEIAPAHDVEPLVVALADHDAQWLLADDLRQ